MSSNGLDLLRLMHLVGLDGPSWDAWRAVLRGFLGLPMTPDALETWQQLTGRSTAPTTPGRELWVVAGRRSGKSQIAALLAVFLTTCRTYTLAPGEVGTLMVLAADRKQARVVSRYIKGLFNASPVLARLVASETQSSISLKSGLVVEVHTASSVSVRGYSATAIICDEVSFWGTNDDNPDADAEVLNALRPALATTGGPLIAITTPHLRRGEAFKTYEKHYGEDGSPVVVVTAPTLALNPLIDQAMIQEAMAADPSRGAAEWQGQWRSDLEQFVSVDVIKACIEPDCRERAPRDGISYAAYCDVSGGSGTDSFTTAIAHTEIEDGAPVVWIDALHECRPPFSPEVAVEASVNLCRSYRVQRIVGDKFGGLWPFESYARHGLRYEPADFTASEAYQNSLPLLNSQRVELLDVDRCTNQFTALERRASRSGRILIGHPVGRHDDLANVTALAIATLGTASARSPLAGLVW